MVRPRYVIVMAGGSGTRMGARLPKQFLDLGGRPVLQFTIGRFLDSCPGVKVVTVLPEEYIPLWKNLCYSNNFNAPQTIAKGGLTRFHSVRNALEKIPDGALVAIHDGVRPFVTDVLVDRLFSMAESFPAVVPVTPCTDTLRPMSRKEGEVFYQRTDDPPVDRSRVFAVQTPQVFHSEIIKDAYRQAYDTSFTDDASVAEKAGVEVRYLDGEKFNIKLTTPDDLRLAKAILSVSGY